MEPWFVYMLFSAETERLYTGISPDPFKRLDQHNAGKGAKATRAGRPWFIVHVEDVPTKSAALKREIVIKKMSRAEKLALVGL